MILSGWNSLDGANGLRRAAPHAGLDLAGAPGVPVLAALDGEVAWAEDTHDACGLGIALKHRVSSPGGADYTIYCHLSAVDVSRGEIVGRGARIGRVGTSGAAVGVPHLHFELSQGAGSHRDGELRGSEDPRPWVVGYFDAGVKYPAGTLALTWPVACTPHPTG